MPRELTYDQVADRKRRAEQFLRDVKQDDDRADEVSDESVEHYAERRHFDIIDNPGERSLKMANGNGDPRTKVELLDEIDQLQQENSDLQDMLDAIQDIVAPSEGDKDDDDQED